MYECVNVIGQPFYKGLSLEEDQLNLDFLCAIVHSSYPDEASRPVLNKSCFLASESFNTRLREIQSAESSRSTGVSTRSSTRLRQRQCCGGCSCGECAFDLMDLT